MFTQAANPITAASTIQPTAKMNCWALVGDPSAMKSANTKPKPVYSSDAKSTAANRKRFSAMALISILGSFSKQVADLFISLIKLCLQVFYLLFLLHSLDSCFAKKRGICCWRADIPMSVFYSEACAHDAYSSISITELISFTRSKVCSVLLITDAGGLRTFVKPSPCT